MTSELVTLLFTDVVGSTELLSRAGEEEAQRIFRLHRHLLTGTVSLHGGHEVKWLGDGLMVAFPSAAEAIACAVAMQQASREPVEGEQLGVRVGLNVGEALREIDDYFGTPVVIARRLCDSAEGGQIRCTQMVADLLAGRAGFSFTDLGRIELKGIPEPVAACEVHYEVASGPAALPARPDMVGREAEFGRLTERVAQAALGQGGLATLTGEPGVGKTRMLEELSEWAGQQGAMVLTGHCFETDWAPPYGPFAEALSDHVPGVTPGELRNDLGAGASSIAQLVPEIREVLHDVPDPVAVQPDEERFRLIDAVAQFIVARSRRAPVMVCLDDLRGRTKGRPPCCATWPASWSRTASSLRRRGGHVPAHGAGHAARGRRASAPAPGTARERARLVARLRRSRGDHRLRGRCHRPHRGRAGGGRVPLRCRLRVRHGGRHRAVVAGGATRTHLHRRT